MGSLTWHTNLHNSLLVHKNAGAGDITMHQLVGFKELDPTKNLRSLAWVLY